MENRGPLAPIVSRGTSEDVEDFMETVDGGCSVSPVRSAADLDRVSNASSNSKSRESLTSTTSRSTMSSIDQHHHQRPRSATTVSGSSTHFLRPKSLAIASGFKVWKKDRAARSAQQSADLTGTSCPAGSRPVRRKSERKSVPLIQYDFVSAPSTPNTEPNWIDQHSISNELIPEAEPTNGKKSGSRLSLNITAGEKARNSSPNARSPKLISRFLRNSFARIMSLRGNGTAEDEADGRRKLTVDSSSDSHHISGSDYVDEDEDDETDTYARIVDEARSPDSNGHYSPCTPSTKAYIEETRQSGLPVIPFEYPTCVLVERMKNRTRERVRQKSGEFASPPTQPLATSSRPVASSIPSTSAFDDEPWQFFTPSAHSPLENLVDIAQQELTEEETLFDLYDDGPTGSNTADGSVGSSCSGFEFYYQEFDMNGSRDRKPSNRFYNNNNNSIKSRDMVVPGTGNGDFFIEDELNLSDPTKSSWRRDLTPIMMLPKKVSGPYMDMSYNPPCSSALSPKTSGRSKAVPIGGKPTSFSSTSTAVVDSPDRTPQYSNVSTQR